MIVTKLRHTLVALTLLSILGMASPLCRVAVEVGFEVAFAFDFALTLEGLCRAVQGHFKFTHNQRRSEPKERNQNKMKACRPAFSLGSDGCCVSPYRSQEPLPRFLAFIRLLPSNEQPCNSRFRFPATVVRLGQSGDDIFCLIVSVPTTPLFWLPTSGHRWNGCKPCTNPGQLAVGLRWPWVEGQSCCPNR